MIKSNELTITAGATCAVTSGTAGSVVVAVTTIVAAISTSGSAVVVPAIVVGSIATTSTTSTTLIARMGLRVVSTTAVEATFGALGAVKRLVNANDPSVKSEQTYEIFLKLRMRVRLDDYSWLFMAPKAESASASVAKRTKPKPRLRKVARSFTTICNQSSQEKLRKRGDSFGQEILTASWISPNCWKPSRKVSSLVCQERPLHSTAAMISLVPTSTNLFSDRDYTLNKELRHRDKGLTEGSSKKRQLLSWLDPRTSR